jgi:phosphoglycolate phosphatase
VRLVLWDIDGTLVDTAGHGRLAFAEAFESAFARAPEPELVPMAGRTDHAIALDILERNGVEDAGAHLPELFEALHTALEARREAIASEGAPQPGIRAALEALRVHHGVLQSVLTGNIERNAHVKLDAFGLVPLLDMEVGGFGSDHGTRSELVGVALAKARERRGLELAPHDVVVIGDTPLDVEAARAAGARAVAVATGPYRLEELRQAAPDAALEDVTDARALLEAIDGPSGALRPAT